MIRMPGKSFAGELPPLDAEQAALAEGLERDVRVLADDIGMRCFAYPEKLAQAADFVANALAAAGYEVERQSYDYKDQTFENLAVEIAGASKPEEIIVIGAHYDAVTASYAANDNGSGVAGLLALARAFAGRQTERTLRFVAFANEEPPFFQTPGMGSYVYARRCRERGERITAMLSLETIGYYTDAPGSQKYPAILSAFHPSTGNFIAFAGNIRSRGLVRRAIASFRRQVQFPSEGAALFGAIEGVGWSDHWSFWQFGYPAIMVTDTAPFRYPYYHTMDDTPDKLDYQRTARVVTGLAKVIAELAGAPAAP